MNKIRILNLWLSLVWWHLNLAVAQTKTLHYLQHYLRRRRLHDVTDPSWNRHAGVMARASDQALLQAAAKCDARDVVPPLHVSAAGKAWRLRHRQTASCKNIRTSKIKDR